MALSDNTRGILLMCGSMMGFTVNDALMKSATEAMPLFQAIFLRGVIATLGLLLIARAQGVTQFLPQGRDIAWPVTVETLVALGRAPHGGADVGGLETVQRALGTPDPVLAAVGGGHGVGAPVCVADTALVN